MLVKVKVKIAGTLRFQCEVGKLFKNVYSCSYELQSKNTENMIITKKYASNEYLKTDVVNMIDGYDNFLLGYYEKEDFEALSKEDILNKVQDKYLEIFKFNISKETVALEYRYYKNFSLVIDEHSFVDIYVDKVEISPLYLEKDEYLKEHLSVKEYMQVHQEAMDLATNGKQNGMINIAYNAITLGQLNERFNEAELLKELGCSKEEYNKIMDIE